MHLTLELLLWFVEWKCGDVASVAVGFDLAMLEFDAVEADSK